MSQASPIAIERPRTRSNLRFLLVAGRVLLGVVFLYAAYAKLHFNGSWHLGDYYFLFAMGIDSYKMVPLSHRRVDGQDFALDRSRRGRPVDCRDRRAMGGPVRYGTFGHVHDCTGARGARGTGDQLRLLRQ